MRFLKVPSLKKLPIGAGLFVLAVTIRLIYLYQSSGNPSFESPVVDAATYDIAARTAAAGQGLNQTFFWQPFFYPAFLSLIYYFSNASIICAKIIQALLGGATCLLTYRLGEKLFNPAAGITAGIMVAFYGPLVFFESELLATGWAAFWSLALVLLSLNAADRKATRLCALLGVCGALSIITRPTFLPFFAALATWLAAVIYQNGKQGRVLALRLTAMLAGFSLVAIPVAVENLRVTGHFGILPASGGINFFVGNNPDYTKTITARPGREWTEITNLPEQNGVIGDMWDEQKYFNARVADFVLTRPLAFAKGLIYKTVQLLSAREIPRNVDLYLFGKWSTLLDLLAWKIDGFGFPFGLLLPLTLLGLAVCWRQIPVPVKMFLLFYPLSLVLVFATARYRAPVIPIMSVIAAAGLFKLTDMIRGRSWRRLAITGLGGAAVVLVATLPGPFPEEQADFEAELYANAAGGELNRGQTDAAIRHLNKALSLQPDYPSAHGNLGMALTRKGRLDEAIRHYNIALRLKDDSAEVHSNLAAALVETGRTEQALIHYSKALAISPGYPEAHYNLGNLLLAENRIKDAIEHLKKAVQTDEDFFEAHNSLAAALAQNGDLDLAVHHFSRAIALRPDEPEPRYNLALTLARAYAAAGNFSAAAAAAEKAGHIAASRDRRDLSTYFQNQAEFYRKNIPGEKPEKPPGSISDVEILSPL